MVILLSRACRPGRCRSVSTYRCARKSEATSYAQPAIADLLVAKQILDDVERMLHASPDLRHLVHHQYVCATTIRRVWQRNGIKPHLARSFKLSRDPRFEDKLLHVVGPSLNPPEPALVLSCSRAESRLLARHLLIPLVATALWYTARWR